MSAPTSAIHLVDPAQSASFPRPGERFRVRSQTGREYVGTLLQRSENGSLFLRLDAGGLARLDQRRTQWASFTRLESLPDASLLRPGDELRLRSLGAWHRGRLAAPVDTTVRLRTPDGLELRYPRGQVSAMELLFRTREPHLGDRFLVRSRSGATYQGRLERFTPDGALVQLQDWSWAELRRDRLDLNSFFVPIPVDPQAL